MFRQSVIDTICQLIPSNDISVNTHNTDIYIDKLKLAFDLHTNDYDELKLQTGRYDRYNKTVQLSQHNIRLIHLFEHQWYTRHYQLLNYLRNVLTNDFIVVGARECKLVKLTSKVFNEFISKYHLQSPVNCSTRLALIHNDNIAMCLGLTRSRFKQDEIELTRFCVDPNYRVIGGLSRLLKHCRYNRIYSYVDYAHYDGHGYFNSGFELLGVTRPNYVWIRGDEVYNRYQAFKHRLPEIIPESFDINLSEYQNMSKAGFVQSFDCGNLKVMWNRRQ